MTIPRIAIACYRPKPGKVEVLLAEVRDHHHFLRSEGLATDRHPIVMRSKDGTIIEVFEWASPAAIAEAHQNPRVQAMWGRFAKCCDYVPLAAVTEAAGMFADLEPIEIRFPPIIQPDPAHRAE